MYVQYLSEADTVCDMERTLYYNICYMFRKNKHNTFNLGIQFHNQQQKQ